MIYLDNAATTKPHFFRNNYTESWMNSNMPYTANREQQKLERAKRIIKSCLGVQGGCVLFFRCATEAVEWLTNKFASGETFCSWCEHDSVYQSCEYLMTDDNISWFNRQEYGLYCHQLVNPVTGDIWNIQSERNKYITQDNQFFGVDLTAAIGHIVLPDNLEDYCDALWFGGHKFYTEKGIGAMWISNKLAGLFGATKSPRNQYGLVHGTVDAPGACMLADAMEFATLSSAYYESNYQSLATELTTALLDNNIGSDIISKDISTKTHAINAIHLDGINADALQTYLASKDIYIGTAHSACSGESDYRILEAMGFDKKVASQTIRVSFSVDNTVNDVKQLAKEIKNFKELF